MLIVPFSVVPDCVVAVRPVAKLEVPAAAPIDSVPVLLNVPAPVTVLLPFSATLPAPELVMLAALSDPATVTPLAVLFSARAPALVIEAIVSVPVPPIVRSLPPPVTAPSVMLPEVPFSVVALASVTGTAPRLIAEAVVLIVPFSVVPVCVVAVRPPVKVLVLPALPSVTVPVLLNVVVPAIVLVVPRIDTL